jgi:hypothetical protein
MTSFVPYGTLTFCKNCGEQNPYHRELTDEEILEVFDDLHDKFKQGFSCLQFARAILKKASERA